MDSDNINTGALQIAKETVRQNFQRVIVRKGGLIEPGQAGLVLSHCP